MKKNSWKKPIIKHGQLTKYNYLVQYPENLKLGRNFDIGELRYQKNDAKWQKELQMLKFWI